MEPLSVPVPPDKLVVRLEQGDQRRSAVSSRMLLGWAVPKQGGISSSPITSIDAFPISSLSVVMGRLFKLKTSVEVIVGLCQPRLLAKVKLL